MFNLDHKWFFFGILDTYLGLGYVYLEMPHMFRVHCNYKLGGRKGGGGKRMLSVVSEMDVNESAKLRL